MKFKIDMKDKKNCFISTPIYYPNSKLHMGHAFTTILADILARYKRQNGYNVLFSTGSDEHGQKIEETAQEKNITPKIYVDKIIKSFKELWIVLGISYDVFVRTSDDVHKNYVKKIVKKLEEEGHVYKGKYEGYYCKSCESFFTKSQLKNLKCSVCGSNVFIIKEDSYFLKVSSFQDWIKNQLENKNILFPKSKVNELLIFISNGLNDLSITRKKVKWGIEFPLSPELTIYVWLDALLNYLSLFSNNNIDFSIDEIWKNPDSEIFQFIGKEITRFHSIYFPIILEMLGYKSNKVYSHGWLLEDGKKMSKSIGNIKNPFDYVLKYSRDVIRFYFYSQVSFFEDGRISDDLIIKMTNGILVNKYSNLISRVYAMLFKYNSGTIPERDKSKKNHDDMNVIETFEKYGSEFNKCMDDVGFKNSSNVFEKILNLANKYIDETKPWSIKDTKRRDIILLNCMYLIFKLNVLISPILIDSSIKVFDSLGVKKDSELKIDNLSGIRVKKIDNLFNRI